MNVTTETTTFDYN